MKKSAKTNGWSRRWFVLNEKTGKVSVDPHISKKKAVIVMLEVYYPSQCYYLFYCCWSDLPLHLPFFSLVIQKNKKKETSAAL